MFFIGFIHAPKNSPRSTVVDMYAIPAAVFLLFLLFLLIRWLSPEESTTVLETQNFGNIYVEDLKVRDMVILDENDSDIAVFDGENFDLKELSELILKLDRLPAEIREKLIAKICQEHPGHFLCGEKAEVQPVLAKHVGIEYLNISIRTYNILVGNGFSSIEDVLRHIEEAAKTQGFYKSIMEITFKGKKLGKNGFVDLWNALVEAGYTKWMDQLEESLEKK